MYHELETRHLCHWQNNTFLKWQLTADWIDYQFEQIMRRTLLSVVVL